MSPPPPDVEHLLAHEGFLRHLAARLVRDPATADDIVQDTWLAALEKPPRTSSSGWLGKVARNAARMRHRSNTRRADRERAVARPEAAPSTAELLERERARRVALGAVLRLDEPYRSTIVLRFYEGLPPRAVAKRMDVPAETVRTRTRRALERMRTDLDQRHDTRRAWMAALAPLTLASAPASAGITTLGGLLAMSATVRFAAVGLVLLLLAGGVGYLVWGSTGDTPDSEDAAALVAGDTTPPSLKGRPDAEKTQRTELPQPPELDVFRHERGRGVLRGIVLSGRTHEPVVGVEVMALLERGKVPGGMRVTSHPQEFVAGTTDVRGRFVIEDVPLGAYRVSVSDPKEGEAEETGLAAKDGPWLRLYPLPPRPELSTLGVRVVDEKRQAVAGAAVECALGLGVEPLTQTTDEEGIARFPEIPFVEDSARGWITASSPEGLGRAMFQMDRWRGEPGGKPLEIVLKQAGALAGSLRGPVGTAFEGTEVVALSLRGGQGMWAIAREHVTRADADGGFLLEPLPEGRYTLLVRAPKGLRMDLQTDTRHGRTDYVPIKADVEAGDTTTVDIPLVAGGAIRGQVVTKANKPVAGARVEVQLPQGPWDYVERTKRAGVPLWRLDSAWPDARRFELTYKVLRTDADGRYEVGGLLPGPYRVRAIPGESLSYDRKEPVEVADDKTVELRHEVEPAGTLEFTARPFASVGFRREGSSAFEAVMVTPRGALGAVTVPGFGVGTWEALSVHSDPSIEPVALETFEIRAGELTYLDLTNAGDVEVTVRILDGGRPVVGALVDGLGYGRTMLETDEHGEVSWRATSFGRQIVQQRRIVLPTKDAVSLVAKVPWAPGPSVVNVPTGGLRVVVRAADGRSIEGATAKLKVLDAEADGVSAVGNHERTTDANGVARWLHLPPGTATLEVRLPESGARASHAVTLTDDVVELEIQPKDTGVVRLRVLNEQGRAALGVRVGASALPADLVEKGWDHATTLTQNGWRTDKDGRFTVRGVPAGQARIHAWVMDAMGFRATHNATTEVTVAPGETVDVELSLKAVER